MPIPKPRKNEKKNDFISRCMGNETMKSEYSDNKQRVAVCQTSWKNKMKNNLSVYAHINNEQVDIRTEYIGNTQYSVVPVVMMVEGVHAGSDGPILYSASQLSRGFQAWNGVPVTIEHPQLEDGSYVSANNPQFFDTQIIGKIFNTTFEEGKLKAEAWLETNKSSNILSYLASGQNLEVSTGLFSEGIQTPGVFNQEEYNTIATEIRPDHLALLPGGTGACSWRDGCGIRANEGKEDVAIKLNKNNFLKFENDSCAEDYDLFIKTLIGNSVDYTQIINELRDKVDSMDVQNEKYYYLRKVFNDFAVYECSKQGTGSKLYKRNYNITDNGIEWTSDPVEVVEQISYSEVTSNMGVEVTKKKDKVCCIEEVRAFVANEDNGYTENDIDWLSKLGEDEFKSIVSNTNIDKIVEKEKEVIVGKEAKTMDELLANASPELRESIMYGQRVLKDKKASLIGSIKANKNNQFTDEELNASNIDFLTKLNSSFGNTNTNYIGNSGGVVPKQFTEPEVAPLDDVYSENK